MKRYIIWVILVFIWLTNGGFVSDEVQVYSKGAEFAESGRKDFAFMYYNELLRSYPDSKYREQALFATGEYYFQVSEFCEAAVVFKEFLDVYPKSKKRLYAFAYLLSIAQRNQDEKSIEELEKKIIDLHRVSFVFREAKEIVYVSPLYQNYKTVIQIDKIQFYVEGELFAQVSF